MVKEKIIKAFTYLGKHIQNTYKFTDIIKQASINNSWFSENFIYNALDNISYMLKEDSVRSWANSYNFNNLKPKNVGLLLPGNIPAVGLHDILCTIASNNIANIKLASADNVIIPFLLETLSKIDTSFKNRFIYVEKFADINALIATGRTETVNYFDEYFKHIPKLIRKHMTSVAILSGNETDDDINSISDDIFLYYGLGCRNVSKIYVPLNYFKNNINLFLSKLNKYKDVCLSNTKYMNNYTYNKALYLLNKTSFIDNDFVTLTKSETLTSRVANINYEEYENITQLEYKISRDQDNLQCISTGINLASCNNKKQVNFGYCQKPHIDSYADNIDTMQFLLDINKT